MLRQEFLRLCRDKYGDRFEYPHLPESVKRSVISIICNKHGKIEMIARDHLRTKHGCPRCANESKRISTDKSTLRWVEKSRRKFKDRFDYSEISDNKKPNEEVEIICPTHGQILISLRTHYYSETGCTHCGRELNLERRIKYKSLDEAIKAAREIHGDRYTYSDFDPIDKSIVIACEKHGTKRRLIYDHLTGRGCRMCGYQNRTIAPDEFLTRANKAHPVGYSYDVSELKTVNDKITITHDCGKVYRARVSNHLSGQGCQRCRSSLGEARIGQFLEMNGIEYIDQFAFENCRYRYDFCIPDLKILIEYDGEQHFRPVDYFGGLEGFRKTQERDGDKNFLAKAHRFILIRVPYHCFDRLEMYLSRAIDKHFRYRVDGVFYRSIVQLCDALGLPQYSSSEDLETYRTFKALKPTQSETVV